MEAGFPRPKEASGTTSSSVEANRRREDVPSTLKRSSECNLNQGGKKVQWPVYYVSKRLLDTEI